MSRDDVVDVHCDEIVHETDNAILVKVDGEEIWFPLSQVEAIHRGPEPWLVVTEWIAKKKDLM